MVKYMRLPFLLVLAAAVIAPAETRAQAEFSVSAVPARVVSAGDDMRTVFVAMEPSAPLVRALAAGPSEISVSGGGGVLRRMAEGRVLATSVSSEGRFVAVISKSDSERTRTSGAILEVFDARLDRHYRVPLRRHPDDPVPSVMLDDSDGSCAVIFHAEGRVLFLSESGDRIAVRSVTEGTYDIERTVVAARASPAAAGLLAVAVNEPDGDRIHGVAADRVRLFDSSGEERGGFLVPRLTVSSLGVSPDAGTIAVGLYDVAADVYRTSFFGPSGNEMHHVDFAAEKIDFDDEGSRALVADKRRLAIVAPGAGATLFEQFSDEPARIFGVALSGTGSRAVALEGTSSFAGGRFILSDLELVELVEEPAGRFAQRKRRLDEQAGSVALGVGDAGVAVALDGLVLSFRKP